MNMFKLGILLVLGLVIIPYARVDAEDSTTAASAAPVQTTASDAGTTQPPTVTKPALTTAPQTTQPPMTSIVIVTTEKPVTVPSIVSSAAPVQTTMVTPVESTAQSGPTVSTTPINTDTTTTTRLTTTAPALSPIFKCDFNGPCFGAGIFEVVTGLQFSPPLPLTLDSEPPRGPTSDALATTNPTDNNEKCDLPFRPQINSTTQTTWDMYFCYNEACPTASSASAGCVLGEYGLIALPPSQSNITVADPLTPNVPPKPRDASGAQCLRFFYYFTVYDGQDWGQQIKFWNKPNNGGERVSVGTFTVNDMKQNKWNRGYIPLQRTSTDSVLEIDFMVANDDRPTNAAKNQTINFAMDVVELYDYNCSYVEEVLDGVVRPVTPPDEPDDKPNLTLILGLSLGLGIPVLLLAIGGTIFVVKKQKGKNKDRDDISMDSHTNGTNDNDNPFDNPSSF